MILRTAMVTEADFAALKALCEKGAVGNTYADFLRMHERDRSNGELLEVQVETVRIIPEEFAGYLGSRKATRGDLIKFAYLVFKKRTGASMKEPCLPD